MIEQTLVLVKPDGVERGLIGEVIKRFEQRGFKIVALKLTSVSEDFAKKHYTEDILLKHGESVYKNTLNYITEGPVVAMIIEGVDAVENVRKIVGVTEAKVALPGTIRGDFCHVSHSYSDKNNVATKNLVHASGNKEEAKSELALWFSVDEIYDYEVAGSKHLY